MKEDHKHKPESCEVQATMWLNKCQKLYKEVAYQMVFGTVYVGLNMNFMVRDSSPTAYWLSDSVNLFKQCTSQD